MTDAEFMMLAIEQARLGIALGQSPFGSVVVRDQKVIAATHNTVWRDSDPSAHAEVNTLRLACRSLSTIDLTGSTLYSTCEPCPMCLSAIHWARVTRLVFGASIADAERVGFREMPIPAVEMVRLGKSPLQVEGGLLENECRELFEEWRIKSGRSY